MIFKTNLREPNFNETEITSSLWVASYSYKQECFHVETYEEYCNYSRECYIKSERPSDYVMLGVFSSCEGASKYTDDLERSRELWLRKNQ